MIVGLILTPFTTPVLKYSSSHLFLQVSSAADRPARRSDSFPPCCTQIMSTIKVMRQTGDRDRHQFTTLTVHLSWQHLRRSAVPKIWLVLTKI